MMRVKEYADDVDARAGVMALDIARAAAGQASAATLFQSLTNYLVTALDVDSASLFLHSADHYTVRSRPSLHAVSLSVRGAQSDSLTRRLKVHAYRAQIAGHAVSRIITGSDVSKRQQVVAVPLGGKDTWGVVAAEGPAHGYAETHDDLARLLTAVAPSLSLAIRQAHLTEVAQHTEHRAAQRSTLFSVTSEAILSIGEDFVIREVNPAFARLSGWPESTAVGASCMEVLKCRDERKTLLCGTNRCPISRAFRGEDDEEQSIRDLTWETRTGKRLDLSASVAVQRTSQDVLSVIVARDVTALNGANRMRANFISMVSHELRTPLNSVNGFLEIVAEGQVGPLNERQLEFLTYARISTQQLTTLVEDILFISKADSGLFTLRVTDVEVNRLVEHALQAVRAAADKEQMRISLSIGPDVAVVRGDELRLQQVLTNLLGNAVKFSPPESVIDLCVDCRGQDVVFSVADRGPGVPVEDHVRIFERFYQSDNAMRERSGGYGLGLAIAKLIVEHHGGRIWVESPPEGGATFYFTVPTS